MVATDLNAAGHWASGLQSVSVVDIETELTIRRRTPTPGTAAAPVAAAGVEQ